MFITFCYLFLVISLVSISTEDVLPHEISQEIFPFLKKILFIYFWREGKGDRKRGRETSVCGCLSVLPTGYLACNLGICPDQESNKWPFGLQAVTQSTEPHQPGLFPLFLFSERICGFFLKNLLKFASEALCVRKYFLRGSKIHS